MKEYMKRIKQKSSQALERIAIRATRWIGSTNSIFVHTLLFIAAFVLYFLGVDINTILLVLTTLVSLEAIYLSIFIQMSVNRQARRLHAVAKDVEEIQEDVEGIEKDVDEIQKDVDEIQEDVEEIQEDVEEIEKDVDDISEEISEDETETIPKDDIVLSRIESTLKSLITEISELKKQNEDKK
jgi:uncharacterized membrane protein